MILSYNNVECFIKPVFSHLGVHQLRNLILIVYGIIHSRSLECAEIVRHVPTDTSYIKKRIHRFLDNKDVDLSVLMKCWCKFVAVKRSKRNSKKRKLEAWYIATDLCNLNMAYALYEKRMWIEEMFRDLKSRFHWCGYKVETERRREMLTFCLMVSYTIVAFLDCCISWLSGSQD